MRFRSPLSRALASAVVATALVVTPVASQAVSLTSWYVEVKGTYLGKANSNVTKSTITGDAIQAATTYADVHANGRGVYTFSDYWYNGTKCFLSSVAITGSAGTTCPSGWWGDGPRDSSGVVSDGKYSTFTSKDYLSPSGNAVRIGIKVCQKEPWYDPDACSGYRYAGFDY